MPPKTSRIHRYSGGVSSEWKWGPEMGKVLLGTKSIQVCKESVQRTPSHIFLLDPPRFLIPESVRDPFLVYFDTPCYWTP